MLSEKQLAAMHAGRERWRIAASAELRADAKRVVSAYREFLHEEAEHWAKTGRGRSWTHVTVPTDAQFAMARS